MEPSSNIAYLFAKFILSAVLGLLKPFREFLAKYFLQSAYEVSTCYRSHRQMKALCQKKLGAYFLYSVNWHKLFLGKEQKMSTVWIKSKEGVSFQRVTLCVNATLEKIRYQSTVILHNVGETITVAAIPSIPLRQIEVEEGNRLSEPYTHVWIELKELVDAKGESIMIKDGESPRITPVDNLEAALGLRKSDVFRWGKWWNLDFLEREKHEFHIKYHGMAFDAKYHGLKLTHTWYSLLTRMSKWNWFLEACFWSKNLWNAKQLRHVFDKSLRGDL